MGQLFTRSYTNQSTSWLMHSWSTFGAQMSHGQTQIHKIHHNPDLKESTTFPLIIFSKHGHGAYTQMSFCPGTLKLGVPKLRLLQLWKPITSCENLRLRWGLKQICSTHQKLFNNMWHSTYTQVNQGNSRLLAIKSQIGNLTTGPFFGHNLCFKYPNGSYELILDIYVSRDFQWYKELFNSMSFDPLQSISENSEVHWNSNSQSGSPLGSVWVHSLTLSYTPESMKCDS
jgi:hypothetical protein